MAMRAVVVGSLVMDLTFRVPRWPSPDDVVVAETFATYRGGKGYNQAVALARLGAEVAMVGCVGDDHHGADFLAALDAEGVGAERVVVRPGVRTSVAVPIVAPDGDVGFVQYPGANRHLSDEDVADLPDCDVLLLQGEVPSAVSRQAAAAMRERGATVLLNPAPADQIDADLLSLADIVTPNRVEAKLLAERFGLDASHDDGEALARALADGGRRAVVTLGARGAAWADGARSGHADPPPIEGAVDATGAGDSFNAALAVAIGEGQDLPDAVRFASAAGAHAVTIAGAEPSLPRRTDVEALLAAP